MFSHTPYATRYMDARGVVFVYPASSGEDVCFFGRIVSSCGFLAHGVPPSLELESVLPQCGHFSSVPWLLHHVSSQWGQIIRKICEPSSSVDSYRIFSFLRATTVSPIFPSSVSKFSNYNYDDCYSCQSENNDSCTVHSCSPSFHGSALRCSSVGLADQHRQSIL